LVRECDVIDPTDMVIVFLVTKPLFLMMVIFLLFVRHHISAGRKREPIDPSRLLPEEPPTRLLE